MVRGGATRLSRRAPSSGLRLRNSLVVSYRARSEAARKPTAALASKGFSPHAPPALNEPHPGPDAFRALGLTAGGTGKNRFRRNHIGQACAARALRREFFPGLEPTPYLILSRPGIGEEDADQVLRQSGG